MDQAQLNWLTNFLWNIADDVLRDVYVRGKYRDVILPMTVMRRLDAVLEPTKVAVLEMKFALDKERITNQDDALRAASAFFFAFNRIRPRPNSKYATGAFGFSLRAVSKCFSASSALAP